MAEDIFDEVDDDLRAERSRERTRRLALFGLLALLVAAVAIGAWQYVEYRHRTRVMAAAAPFFAAQADADVAPPAAAGPDAKPTAEQLRAIPAFRRLADTGPAGFATLARLRLAALEWRNGDRAAALRDWTAIADDARADADFRSLAALIWVQHRIGEADPGLLKTRLRPALAANSPWRLLAQEADAYVDLQNNDPASARRKLSAISGSAEASEGERARATGVLETLAPAKSNG